ncbi:MAG: aryl-sulfate sulfotransferase [Bacteroidota bacterium]
MIRCLLILFLVLAVNANAQNHPQFNVSVYDSSGTGYYFLVPIKMGPQGANFNPYHLILDSVGKVVYYKEFVSGLPTGDFKVLSNGLMTYTYMNKYYLMDSSFTILDSVSCKNGVQHDGHDMQLTSSGEFLLMGSEYEVMDLSAYYLFSNNGSPGSATANVKAAVIQIQDTNKNVVFEWHSKDHFSFLDVDTARLNSPMNIDWTHSNAVTEDTDGNILLSSRHFNEITKINRTTGAVMWRLGGNANQFSFLNDPAMFKGQHDCRRIANGHLTLFDNGAPGHPAAAKEYLIDEINLTATLVWSYVKDSSIFSLSTGNVQRLENGNTLIDFGNLNVNIFQPAFEVVDSGGQKIFEITFADTLLTYRAFNFSNLPFKFDRPLISCNNTGGIGSLETGLNSSYFWNTGATSQSITISSTGEYSVFVPEGNDGFISSSSFVVSDISDPCNDLTSSISQNELSEIKVFPNPNTGTFSIVNFDPNDSFRLMSLKGEIIAKGKCEDEKVFSDLDPGVYFLELQRTNSIRTIRILIL